MHGLSHVVGIGPRVTLNGKDYQVRGKTNRFSAELEAEILKLRGDPFDMIVEAGRRAQLDNNPDLLNTVADVVTAKFRNWRTITYYDYLEFMNSPSGDALTVFHCLKQDAPELTYDDVKHFMVQSRLLGNGNEQLVEELRVLFKAIEVASGEDQLGNSNGRPPQVPENPAKEQTGS